MQKLLLTFGLFLVALTVQAQTVYVDADAGGSNDGTSWANAYTDLATAIDSAAAGSQLWIAAGTYVTPETSPFFIDRALSLYGGFAGTETEVTQADPAANVTILSGDVAGNDVDGSYDAALAADNNRVLVVIDTNDTSQFTVAVDGVTISHGVISADYDGEDNLLPFAGGGLYSEARTRLSRVIFTENRAPFGAASAQFFATSIGSVFDDITSEGNFLTLSGAHYLRFTDSVEFRNSTFTGNPAATVPTGFFEVVQGDNLVIDNCSFADLRGAGGSAGSAMLIINSFGTRITNSTFSNLAAEFGGALYVVAGDAAVNNRPTNVNDFVIEDSEFTDVSANTFGGAILFDNIDHRISGSSFTDGTGAVARGVGGAIHYQNGDTLSHVFAGEIDDCTFTRNISGNLGGALFYNAFDINLSISNSIFDGNDASVLGGAICLVGEAGDNSTQTVLTNCDFVNNVSNSAGGAATFLSETTTLVNCEFRDNQSNSGALFVGGGGKQFRVRQSLFEDNGGATTGVSAARGAAIYTELGGGDLPDTLIVDNCSFQTNSVTQDDFISGGGAIHVNGDAGTLPLVEIRNSAFNGNSAEDRASGGAIEVVRGADLRIFNSDFFGNSTEDGSGGAISMLRLPERDTIDNEPIQFYGVDDVPQLTIDRSLFVNNTSRSQGGAINLGSSPIDMRNSILLSNSVNLPPAQPNTPRAAGGSGGAIIINGSDLEGAELDNYLINNTFYNNLDGGITPSGSDPGTVGNAVAIFQPGGTDPDTNYVSLTLQNNAFVMESTAEESIGFEQNLGDQNDETGFGEINIISLGGNFFNSALSDYLDFTTDNDIVDASVASTDVFIDPRQDDRESEFPNVELLDDENNPLIDGGTTGERVPEVDFYGNDRDNVPDIGALEVGSVPPTGVAEPIEESGLAFEFFPNPTTDVLTIVNSDRSISNFTVLLSDAQGRHISGSRYRGVRNDLRVSELPAGVYHLTLLVNDKVYSKQFVKR